jgi:hypothetical protein
MLFLPPPEVHKITREHVVPAANMVECQQLSHSLSPSGCAHGHYNKKSADCVTDGHHHIGTGRGMEGTLLQHLLEVAVLQSKKESTQDSIASMTAPAILYVGYGLPFKVFYNGSQPLCSLLSSSSQYSRLSIESEIRPLVITNLHRSSLLTSFVF